MPHENNDCVRRCFVSFIDDVFVCDKTPTSIKLNCLMTDGHSEKSISHMNK